MSKIEKLVEDLSGLTVLEAAELAKLLEDKWGVKAAPVAVAPASQRVSLNERATASASATRCFEARSPTMTFTWYSLPPRWTSAAAPRPAKHSMLGR